MNLDQESQVEDFGKFRNYLETMSNSKMVQSTLKDKLTFLEYWNSTQGNYLKEE